MNGQPPGNHEDRLQALHPNRFGLTGARVEAERIVLKRNTCVLVGVWIDALCDAAAWAVANSPLTVRCERATDGRVFANVYIGQIQVAHLKAGESWVQE